MQKNTFEKNKKSISKSYSNSEELPKKNILGVGVTDDSKENILKYIVTSLQKKEKTYYIVTPNPEIIVAASKNNDFKNVLNSAKLALNDGVGVGLAARMMGIPLHGRFTGVELVEKLCEKSNDWPITVGFLGAGPNVAEKAAQCLKEKYPKLQVVFAREEWDGDTSVKIDILFVAFGAPKQEFWMHEHVGKIPVKVMVGVGGALDQIVDPSLRPPKGMQAVGLGWLYRLIRQPWRWKRQLALIEFMGMILKEKISFSS